MLNLKPQISVADVVNCVRQPPSWSLTFLTPSEKSVMFKTRIVSHSVLSTGESNFVLHEKFSEIWSSAICHGSTVSILVTQCSMVLVLLFHGGGGIHKWLSFLPPALYKWVLYCLSYVRWSVDVWDKLLSCKELDRKRKTFICLEAN